MKLKDKCQCNLCDCGRHRCELHGIKIPKYVPIPCDPANFKTSYQDQYKGNADGGPPRPCVPVVVQTTIKLPFYGSTESKAEFHEKEIPRRFKREQQKYEKPSGNMAMVTTKSSDYTVKALERLHSYKPDLTLDAPRELPTFEGETTTNSFYKAYKQVQRQPMFSEHPDNLKCNSDKFEGLTTANYSYPAYSRVNERTLPIKPVESQHIAGEVFYGVTTTAHHYKGLAGEVPKPYVQVPSFTPPQGEMCTETTTQAHYKAAASSRPQAIIPQSIRHPPLQFQGQTTNMDMYPVHPITSRPKAKEKQKYVPPTEKMDTISAHREYFKPHTVQRRIQKLSPLPRKHSVPKFESKTTHQDQYRPWKIERQQAYAEPIRVLRPPIGKMETKTMQRSDFIYDKSKVQRAKPIIPQVMVIRSDQPIDTVTSYGTQFKGAQNKCRLGDMLMLQSQQLSA